MCAALGRKRPEEEREGFEEGFVLIGKIKAQHINGRGSRFLRSVYPHNMWIACAMNDKRGRPRECSRPGCDLLN